MKRFKVTSPEGKSLVLTSQDDMPPSEQELEQVFSGSSSPVVPEQPIQPQTEKEPYNPIKKTMDILGGGFKRQMNTGPTSFNTITGGPATEFAHGVKTEAMTQAGMPELVAESASMATDPQNIIGSLTALSPSLAKMFRSKSTSKMSSARDLFRKILPSQGSKQTEANVKMKELPEVEVGTNYMKKSKSYGDLVGEFKSKKGEAITRRQGELEAGAGEIKDSVNELTSTLSNRVKNMRTSNREKPGNIRRTEEILNREVDALLYDQERMTIDKAERIKELYQGKAQTLYDKSQKGSLTGNESIELSAYADLAQDAKNLVDRMANVSPTNREIQGLGRSERLAGEQQTAFQQRRPEGLLRDLISALRGGPQATGAAVIRGVFGREVPLSSTTGKIAKMVGQSNKSGDVADLLEKLAGSSYEAPPQNKLLPAPIEEPQGQRLLPAGQGFEKLSPEAQAQALAEYEERIMTSMNQEKPLGLPEFTGDPNVIKEGRVGQPRDVRGVSKLYSDSKTSLRELVKRRKKNFGGK